MVQVKSKILQAGHHHNFHVQVPFLAKLLKKDFTKIKFVTDDLSLQLCVNVQTD